MGKGYVKIDTPMVKKKNRFEPLDYFRGFVILIMVITEHIGNSSRWDFIKHADWNGFHFIDWVFAALIICMGFAMVFSLARIDKFDKSFFKKVLIRGFGLIGIGLLLSFFSNLFTNLSSGLGSESFINALDNLRLYGILQRLGFVYLVSAFIIILTKKKCRTILIVATSILLAYMFILGFGHGYTFSTNNIIYMLDNAIFPAKHLYSMTVNGLTLSFDPEGGLSMLPCIAEVLLGYSIGKLFINHKDKKEATLGLFATSTIIIIIALFLSLFVPINKKVWSTSYTLLTTGMSFMAISLLSFLTLKKPHEKWFYVFKVVGVNALGVYIFSNLLGFIFDYIKVNNYSFKYYINDGLVNMCMGNEYVASFIYSIIMLLVVWLFAFLLHKKKIIIKL